VYILENIENKLVLLLRWHYIDNVLFRKNQLFNTCIIVTVSFTSKLLTKIRHSSATNTKWLTICVSKTLTWAAHSMLSNCSDSSDRTGTNWGITLWAYLEVLITSWFSQCMCASVYIHIERTYLITLPTSYLNLLHPI